ncbi:universal stress protein [Ramlibacter monticola]|uniref:Universal stress protein n=1 Tax=Ramlibacter monticola TaxID=1926872 RepID=A0A936Z2N7_9BURK|nr:universal stress protein [Ramlibacter monticola]MBL0393066.1 universal stress protein [Ramlibacter monticola]
MYQRILVPVDGSDTAVRALVAALQMARESGARVRLVHVLDEMAYLAEFDPQGQVIATARHAGGKALDDAMAIARASGVPADCRMLEAQGRRLGEVVADEVRNWEADLVVVGTHGRRGVERALLGSGAEQVLRLTPVPVLAIRSPEARAIA